MLGCDGVWTCVFRFSRSCVNDWLRGMTEYCFIMYWEEVHLKEICMENQCMEQLVPDSDLLPLGHNVQILECHQVSLSVRGVCTLLLRLLSDGRDDIRLFVVTRQFDESVFLQCFR